MSQERWSAVDRYVEEMVVGEDVALADARQASADAGLPSIALTPALGKLVHVPFRFESEGSRILHYEKMKSFEPSPVKARRKKVNPSAR